MAQARPLTESLILANSYLETSSCSTCYLGPMTEPLPASGNNEGEVWDLDLQKTKARTIAFSRNIESLLEKSRPRRSVSVKEYRQSALEGCRACSGMVRFLDHVLPKAALEGEHSRPQVHWWMPHATFQVEWVQTPFKKVFTEYYELFMPTAATLSTAETERQTGLPVPSLPVHPFIQATGRPSADTSSEEAFTKIKTWIRQCCEHHPHCLGPELVSLPHRVLEIQSIEPLRVRVVENRSVPGRYVCFSYRWGPETKRHSLTRANYAHYKDNVPEASVYPLVKDAVTAAFRLGFVYMWIDAYCIIQDDEKDWQEQAKCSRFSQYLISQSY